LALSGWFVKFPDMPPPNPRNSKPPLRKPLEEVVAEQGLYPIEAFDFVRQGLAFTVEKIHSHVTDPKACRHVSGQQLCHGLREYALARWGMMARTVLNCWGIRRTDDFGKIVFTLIDCQQMSKTDEDTLEVFSRVYEFATAFDAQYLIDPDAIRSGIASHS
jgi:uncharacterized repeat protein (TIGR04138 family)